MKLVKVARVGSKVKEVCVNSSADVFNTLDAAGMYRRSLEEAWVNHRVVTGAYIPLNNETIILEERSLSPAIREFIDKLFDHDIIEGMEYDDVEEGILYDECYNDHKSMIDDLMNR